MYRYYVVLCTADTMQVPIKTTVPYANGNLPFSAGCPQFFGGGGNNVGQTLIDEVSQESRGTLQFVSRSEPLAFHQGQAQGQQMRFYISKSVAGQALRWQATGVAWDPDPPPPNDREMDRIVEVRRADFLADDLLDDDAILNKLRLLTGTLAAPNWAEFRQSETAKAFVKFIRDKWPQG